MRNAAPYRVRSRLRPSQEGVGAKLGSSLPVPPSHSIRPIPAFGTDIFFTLRRNAMGTSSGWIGIDLDGTLAHYDGWRGIEHVGDPVPAMADRVREWAARGQPMKIFTARVCVPEPDRSVVVGHIHAWLERHGLPKLEVTNIKDFAMIELWDDRAVQVQINTGRRMDCVA